MKKILSTTLALLLVLTTVFSVSLSAQAAVRYDSDNARPVFRQGLHLAEYQRSAKLQRRF